MELKKVTKLKEMKNILIMDDLKKKVPEMFLKNGSMKQKDFEKLRALNPIQVRHDKNSISFTLQNGPAKVMGKNGCDILDMLIAVGVILNDANEELPCNESSNAVQYVLAAINQLKLRDLRREKEGTAGTMKENDIRSGSYLIIRDDILMSVAKDENLHIGDIIPFSDKKQGTKVTDVNKTEVIRLTKNHVVLLDLVKIDKGGKSAK